MLTGLDLKVQRVKRKLKVKDVSEFLGVHYTYISKLEAEVQSIPCHIYEQWVKFLNLNNNKKEMEN